MPIEIPAEHSTFDAKAGSLPRAGGYVAVKINANYPANRTRQALPTIEGAVYLADAGNGRPWRSSTRIGAATVVRPATSPGRTRQRRRSAVAGNRAVSS